MTKTPKSRGSGAGRSQQRSVRKQSDREASAESGPPIVGIGASAGGIGAFQSFATAIPKQSGIAWVLIQHMAPDRESHLHDILARKTDLPVTEVKEETTVEADRIYVIAPGRTMTIHDGVLHPVRDDDLLARRTSIDAFFLSLAEDACDRCGCALLSGAGSDGTIGLKAIKEAGGLTVTQSLGSAEYDSMLLSAVRTGLVDRELSLEDMPQAFVDFIAGSPVGSTTEVVEDGDRLRVCRLLHSATGHDFSGYKHSTVDRRIRRRMQMLKSAEIGGYLQRLESDKQEAMELFRDLLIGVTQFFRDREAFEALANRVLPKIFEGKSADDEIRVWVPGCATGEEAYTVAILLYEQATKMESPPALKVFGSDIDENALHAARLGRYPKGIVADVSPERLETFFDREDGTYSVRPHIRELCLFAQHNVLRDPPFSRVHLISCRNLLIYMNTTLQKRLVPVFHYAIRPDGFLILGPAENAAQHTKLFAELDRKQRIFQRIGESGRLPEFPIASGDAGGHTRDAISEKPAPKPQENLSPAIDRLLDQFTPAYVVIDSEYEILEASAGTGAYLELPSGRPRVNLGAMARSGLAIDVRAAVAKVMSSGHRETRTDLVVGSGDSRKGLSLVVEPLPGSTKAEQHYLVVFQEIPAPIDLSGRKRTDRDDEINRALENELQATKERLQTTAEELETSNEELRASNEELSSVNEELQSSNEELETSKEELQSINEELRTVNNELGSRVDELSRANNDLKNLFANTQIAMLFLDYKFRIMNFTPPAKPLFRLRDHDVGRPLDELAGQMDYVSLKAEVHSVIKGGEPVEHVVETPTADGEKSYLMRVLPYHDQEDRVSGAVLTFIDITERKHSEDRLSMMVSELNHRVKNNLATVQAIMRQTANGASSVEELTKKLDGRLRALASAHNILSASNWESANLDEIARSVLEPYWDNDADRIEISGPTMRLRPTAAVSLSMVINELATNAAKYGALSVNDGHVRFVWEYRKADGSSLRFSWAESGGPPSREPEHVSFGSKLIEQCIQYELRGTLEREYTEDGFKCDFALPCDGLIDPMPDS